MKELRKKRMRVLSLRGAKGLTNRGKYYFRVTVMGAWDRGSESQYLTHELSLICPFREPHVDEERQHVPIPTDLRRKSRGRRWARMDSVALQEGREGRPSQSHGL